MTCFGLAYECGDAEAREGEGGANQDASGVIEAQEEREQIPAQSESDQEETTEALPLAIRAGSKLSNVLVAEEVRP